MKEAPTEIINKKVCDHDEQKRHFKSDHRVNADSQYVAIPNDLYPAYREVEPEKEIVVSNSQAPLPVVVTCEGDHSDDDDCETAQETPEHRSRFASQIMTNKQEQNSALELCHSKAQFSPIGNAFTPVGQPQISEYQMQDLNDLTSCINAH
ncbi:hypothetical protein GCK32_002526 [Trichostrongylus colubriformis]|uniref:Uncharacterized protein n=1 Tax=Trichostrongylus colubriformis TaxID=6319 RepID=A0AAN8FB61_TRICO